MPFFTSKPINLSFHWMIWKAKAVKKLNFCRNGAADFITYVLLGIVALLVLTLLILLFVGFKLKRYECARCCGKKRTENGKKSNRYYDEEKLQDQYFNTVKIHLILLFIKLILFYLNTNMHVNCRDFTDIQSSEGKELLDQSIILSKGKTKSFKRNS